MNFVEHEETGRFCHNLHIIARLQRREAWAEFAVRDGNQIELEIRVIRRVNVRVGALHAFAVDIQPQLCKLPGCERVDGSMQGETK